MKANLRMKIWLCSVLTILLFCSTFFVLKNTENNHQLIVKYKNSKEIKLFNFNNKISLDIFKIGFKINPNIETISNNVKYKITTIPNDPEFPSQNYLKQINADLGWTFMRESPNVTIAVIDTGVDVNHSDLKENIWKNSSEIPGDGIDNDVNGYIDDVYGWDFVNNSADSGVKISRGYKKYAVNHGTVIAGIIAATGDNLEGISGITWKAKIMSLRAIDSQGEGNTYNIARAIDYAVKNGADIINLSFVGNENDPILADAIRRASIAKVAIVAAAGNETSPGMNLNEYPRYPVCYDFNTNTVFGVGSVDKKNVLSYFSNYGSNCIDILAPGENFKSTEAYYPELFDFKEKYGGSYSGTSLSAPLVSGTLALLKAINPNFTVQEIYKIIQDSAKDIKFENINNLNDIGTGLLDVNKAIILAREISRNRENLILTMPKISNDYSVKIFDSNSGVVTEKKLQDKNINKYKNYFNIKTGDINGDKNQEIIISATNITGTYINTYDQNFKKLNGFKIEYKNPISIDIADLYKSGREKIIVSSAKNYDPKVSIYEANGTLLNSFSVYNKNIRSGISIATCDIDQDYQEEIITAPYSGSGPQIAIYSKEGKLKGQFFAGNKAFRGGLNISCGDLNSDKQNEILVTTQSLSAPYVLTYSSLGELLSSFIAYDAKYTGSVVTTISDIDFDYQNEIIINTGFFASPHIRIFDSYGTYKKQFFAYDSKLRTGVSLTILKKYAKNN